MIYLTILTCAIVAMIIGTLWFGPIFGKRWQTLCGVVVPEDPAARKEMMKGAYWLYIIQFLLSFFQIFILAVYIYAVPGFSGVENAMILCAAFVLPTYAGAAMWSGDTTKVKLEKFLIQAGYAVVLFIVFGAIIGLGR